MKLVALLLVAGVAFAQFGGDFFAGLENMIPGCGGQQQQQGGGLWGPSGGQQGGGGGNFWGTPNQDANSVWGSPSSRGQNGGWGTPSSSGSGWGVPSNPSGWGAPQSLYGNCYPYNQQSQQQPSGGTPLNDMANWVSNPFNPSESNSGQRDPNVVTAQTTKGDKDPNHEVTEDPERVRQIMESLGMMSGSQEEPAEQAEAPAPKKTARSPQKKLQGRKDEPAAECPKKGNMPQRTLAKAPTPAEQPQASRAPKRTQKAAPVQEEEAPLEADSDGYKPFYRNSPYATCITPLSRPTKMQVPTRDAGRSRCTRFFPKRPAPPAPAPVEEEVPTEGEDAHEESE